MDRQSLLGLAIIAMLLTLWLTWNRGDKQEEQLAAQKKQDSLAQVELLRKQQLAAEKKKQEDSLAARAARDTSFNMEAEKEKLKRESYGFFYGSSTGEDTPIILENNKVKASVSPLGGRVSEVELKGVQTWDGKPLFLFKNDSARFGLEFFDIQRRRFLTDTLFFKAETVVTKAENGKPATAVMRLYADSSTTSYIEFKYSLPEDSYMMGINVSFVGCDKIFNPDASVIDLVWGQKMPSQEKSLENQRAVATVFYRFDGEEDVENLSETEDETKELTGEIKWVSFKQQYFSTFLIADKKFANGATVDVKVPADPFHVKNSSALLPIPFGKTANETFAMQFYFGPNSYSQLKSYDLLMEREINLGISIIRGMNKYIFIPIFDWLGSFGWNYGLVILLMTVIVKIVLFPIAYKSYLSSAKMRVLKPEIDELNEKFKDDDPLKKQQATMGLYRKAGVNPAAGCIPLLLQIPILFALIRLFPAAYELRQASFWWAHDLSTYDSIYEFGFRIPGYGDHISLWALLMTISTLLYTWMNQQTMNTAGPQLPGMKWLIYLMPVLFLGFLNNYSSGLSYYYFLSNMITFGQMAMMRKFVDENAIHAKIQENKKKPVKTSGFMQRLEQAQKKRLEEMKQGNNKKKK